MKIRAIDVFGGCGGLSQGLKKAGFDVIAAIEKLDYAREVYGMNHPNTVLFTDVKSVRGSDLLSGLKLKKGKLDLLAGCPPCQGFSSLRRKNRKMPVRDERNELIFEFVRLVKELLPKTILIENVPALIKDHRLKKAETILKDLGYTLSKGILDASDFGVPQRRKRMILVGSRFGRIELPVSKQKSIITVRKAIGNLPSPQKSKEPLHRLISQHSDRILSKISKIPHNGGGRSDLKEADQLDCHKRLRTKIGGGFNDVYGRLWWDKEASTITRFATNPSKGRFLHPVQNRALSVFEASLLQSFPKSYKFPVHLGILKLSSLIGEALPPKFAEAQARSIQDHLSQIDG